MAQHFLIVAIMVVLAVSVGVSAKRGCSAFGHSCFGGHGKRSGDTPISVTNNDNLMRSQLGQEEIPPHPVYPHNGYRMLAGDDIIPIRDGGVIDREEVPQDVTIIKLRNLLKHWMDSYRRSRQIDDEIL